MKLPFLVQLFAVTMSTLSGVFEDEATIPEPWSVHQVSRSISSSSVSSQGLEFTLPMRCFGSVCDIIRQIMQKHEVHEGFAIEFAHRVFEYFKAACGLSNVHLSRAMRAVRAVRAVDCSNCSVGSGKSASNPCLHLLQG